MKATPNGPTTAAFASVAVKGKQNAAGLHILAANTPELQ